MKYLFAILLFAFCSCKKPSHDKNIANKTYSVTFTFKSNAPAYFVSISDVTNLNDFSDSIRTKIFTKTIIYTYLPTSSGWLCGIDNANGEVSWKQILIVFNGKEVICEDDLYSQLSCQYIP